MPGFFASCFDLAGLLVSAQSGPSVIGTVSLACVPSTIEEALLVLSHLASEDRVAVGKATKPHDDAAVPPGMRAGRLPKALG